MPYKNGQRDDAGYKKMQKGATVMSGTRQTSNRVGSNPKLGGQPAKKVVKGGGAKSSHGMMGLQIGTRVTSRDTRKR
jgi:hypothetical protein